MINDYDTLQTAVAQWLARADLNAAIPNFIQLAEARMNTDMRMQAQQVVVSGVSSGGFISTPAGLRQIQALIMDNGGAQRAVYPVPPVQNVNADIVYCPVGYQIVSGGIQLVGTQDGNYTLTYFTGIPSLSDDNTQNWLILLQPAVYLYATLLEASVYLRDDDRINLFGSGYQNGLAALKKQDEMLRFGPSPRPHVDFNTP